MNYPSYVHFTDSPAEEFNSIKNQLNPDKTVFIVDENTKDYCLDSFNSNGFDGLITIQSGERNKTLKTCETIWDRMTQYGLTRKSLVVNLGGGVIGDMGGFCAATYKRGISFINIPTTLLAAVDANIGGKLGIDFGTLKNHIGVFKDPDAVIVSSHFLKTLPDRELRSGFAEVIKHGLIQDANYWEEISTNYYKSQDWDSVIRKSVEIKSCVVDIDPNERGLRKILNFGHTLGHALEAYFLDSEKHLLHGEAIATGMILEAHLSLQKGLLSNDELEKVTHFITTVFPKISLPEITELKGLLNQDKKNSGGKISYSLIEGLGSCIYDQEVSSEQLENSWNYYLNLI